MKTGDFDQLSDDVFRRHEVLPVEGAGSRRDREEVVFAADITRSGEAIVKKEPTHQKEVGGVQHLLQSRGQAVVSLEEPELSQRRLLFLLSQLCERLLEGVAPLVRPVLA